MLSAATAVLFSSQALADTELKTVVTTAQKTSSTGNLTIDATGGINFKSTTVPILTLDAGTSATPITVTNLGGSITGTDTGTAVGVLIDGTKNPFGSFDNSGTIDLTGTGITKEAVHLSGTTGSTFDGPITFESTSVVKVAGDSSIGVVQDTGFVLNGDMTFGGSFTMSPTTPNGSSATSIQIANLLGTINGNVIVSSAATLTAVGNGASGISIGGPIMACNISVTPSCTETGTFANSGTISALGVATRSSTVKNAESGSAVVIGNDIAGGFLNNGSATGVDGVTNAVITANGVNAPVLSIAPSLLATSVNLGALGSADLNGTFGFVNRGSITATAEDNNANTLDVSIAGGAGQLVNITGGLFNSGIISATATSTNPGNAVNATALQIGQYVTIPSIEVSAEGGTSTGNGHIAASIGGTDGGTATAILISGVPVNGNPVTHVTSITVDTGASILAAATVTDPTSANVTTLTAIAIEDRSNSLQNITNNVGGTISATVTTLTNGSTSHASAVDVSLNTQGLTFVNNATVTGDVLFGQGTNSYTLTGTLASPATQTGAINFAGGTNTLTLNGNSTVTGAVTAEGALTVTVGSGSTLNLQNIVTATAHTNLEVTDFTTMGGNLSTVNVTVTGGLNTKALIQASDQVSFSTGTNFNVSFGSFVPQGGTFELISAPHGNLGITANDLANYALAVNGGSKPFLFDSSTLAEVTVGGNDILELTVVPKSEAELGLTGYASQIFPFANAAAQSDDALGAALVAGINSQADAEAAYSAFVPDVSGGTRAVAISLTDQGTGVVAARQRQLQLFAKEPGELTLWGNEFGEYMSTHGQTLTGSAAKALNVCAAGNCPAVQLPGFKDHGFGFSLGLDDGSPEDGWYGGAFSFYTGDVQAGQASEPANSRTSELWYLLTGYTDWRGRGLFVDSQFSVGYGSLKGKRFLNLTIPIPNTTDTTTFSREADSNRAALLGSIGATMGALMKFGSTFVTPQISLDGMSMREEGYTEVNGGTGFDLAVKPYYANSLRTFLGTEVREDINLGDFFLQPSARVGYRFDFINDAAKLHAAFADINSSLSGNQPGTPFVVQGPDPSRGNLVGGLNLNATTDNWTIGLSYDFVRGSSNATEQTGTISLLGRI